MKKWIWIPIIILLIILLSCQKQNKQEPEASEKAQKEENIAPVGETVRENLLTAMEELKAGKAGQGAQLLLETVLLVKPKENFPKGFENKIFRAKEQFQSGGFNKGAEFISEALDIFKSATASPQGNAVEKSSGLEQVQSDEVAFPITEKIRNNILRAMELFREGNADKGIVLILESLLLFSPRED